MNPRYFGDILNFLYTINDYLIISKFAKIFCKYNYNTFFKCWSAGYSSYYNSYYNIIYNFYKNKKYRNFIKDWNKFQNLITFM